MKTILTFPFFYLKEVVLGTLQVARDVLLPQQRLSPVLLHVGIKNLSPGQRLLLACLVSMTPGTISIDECHEDGSFLVHSLYGAENPQAAIDHLNNNYKPFVQLIPI